MNDGSLPAPAVVAADDLVSWNVMEEHLDEAEYTCQELEVQLEHASLSMTQVEEGIEARLRAHVDGLVIGGELVARQLLAATFSDPDVESGRVAAAAFALMHGTRPKLAGEALIGSEERVRRAALRGITLADPEPIRAWALDRFRERPAAEIQASLLPLVAAGLPAASLLECLQSEHEGLAAAAARCIAPGPPAIYQPCMETLLEHESADVRGPAMLATLAWGSSRAWSTLGKQALSGEQRHAPNLALYAALSGPSHHARLLELLKRDDLRPQVLFALGFTGNPQLIPALLDQLRSPNDSEAKLAAQSIQLITGLDTQADAYCLPDPEPREPTTLPAPEDDPEAQASLPAFDQDDLAAQLVPIPEASMPMPDAAAISKYWEHACSKFSDTQRYVLGQPAGVATMLDALSSSRMRVRHVLAEALGVRTAGQCWLDTRQLVSRQRSRLAGLRGLNLRSFARQFGH